MNKYTKRESSTSTTWKLLLVLTLVSLSLVFSAAPFSSDQINILPSYSDSVFTSFFVSLDEEITIVSSQSTASFEFSTAVESDATLFYGISSASQEGASSVEQTREHKLVLNDLELGTEYAYRIELSVGNTSAADSTHTGAFWTKDDTIPGRVQNVALQTRGPTTASFSWDALPINDLGYYRVDVLNNRRIVGTYETAIEEITVDGLTDATSFSMRVYAVDVSGNQGDGSEEFFFTTTPLTDNQKPPVLDILSANITDTAILLHFTTDIDATYKVTYGKGVFDQEISSNSLATDHQVVLPNLARSTAYTYKITVCSEENFCTSSESFNVTTAAEDTYAPFLIVFLAENSPFRRVPLTIQSEPLARITITTGSQRLAKTVGANGILNTELILADGAHEITIEATDVAGNKAEAQKRNVYVDSSPISLSVQDIAEISAVQNPTLIGSVNKNVTLSVYISTVPLVVEAPPKPTNFKVVETATNTIELEWDYVSTEEFSEYLVYRDSVLYATTTDSSFSDTRAIAGKTYNYAVSVLDEYCNEGERALTTGVTREGEDYLTTNPPRLNIKCNRLGQRIFQKELFGNFNTTLNLREGYNYVTILAEDKVGRRSRAAEYILLDTRPPTIQNIQPRPGSNLYDVHADHITIRGITEPFSKVELYAEKSVGFDLRDTSSDLSPETNAKFTWEKVEQEDVADEDGTFHLKNINLIAHIRGGLEPIRTDRANQNAESFVGRDASTQVINLRVNATDRAGLSGYTDVRYVLGRCTEGIVNFFMYPDLSSRLPRLINVERVAAGTEEISFYLNFDYIGSVNYDESIPSTQKTKVTGVDVSVACDEVVANKKGYDTACRLIKSCRSSLNAQGTLAYVTCQMNRDDDLGVEVDTAEEFFEGLYKGEMILPLKARVTYQENDDGELSRGFQTSCFDVAYPVDEALINPKSVLPDWLLIDGVENLNVAIKNLQQFNNNLGVILRVANIGCFSSIVGRYAAIVAKNLVCTLTVASDLQSITAESTCGKCLVEFAGYASSDQGTLGQLYQQSNLQGYVTNLQNAEGDDTTTLLKDLVGAVGVITNELDVNIIPDQCFSECFPSCNAMWNTEAVVYGVMRSICDRTLCKSTPAGWTHDITDTAIVEREQLDLTYCSGDEDTIQGRGLAAKKCTDFESSIKEDSISEEYLKSQECVSVPIKTEAGIISEIYAIGPEQSPNVVIACNVELPGCSDSIRLYKPAGSGRYYLYKQPRSCSNACGVKIEDHTLTPSFTIDSEVSASGLGQFKGDGKNYYGYTTVQSCRLLQGDGATIASSNPGFKIEEDGEARIKYAYTQGWTDDCYPLEGSDGTNLACQQNIVALENPATREECCCLGTEEGSAQGASYDEIYYQPTDFYIEKKSGDEEDAEGAAEDAATDAAVDTVSDSAEGAVTTYFNPPAANAAEKEEKYGDMAWSYRYFRLNYAGKQYNPRRYITGHDVYACFGQNNWIGEATSLVQVGALGVETSDSTIRTMDINPQKEIFASAYCGCISGVHNRVQTLTNILSLIRNCLVDVREDTLADSAVCKEIFTQYVCDTVYDGVKFLTDRCVPNSGVGATYPDADSFANDGLVGGTVGLIGAVGGSVLGSIDEASTATVDDYPALGVSGAVDDTLGYATRAICLGAFGFGWDFNIEGVFDSSYVTPFASLVHVITKSREMVGVDPIRGESKYDYGMSWVVNPGCDIARYKVELACVSAAELGESGVDCSKVEDPYGSNCDCAEGTKEKTKLVFSGLAAAQNQLIEGSVPSEVVQSEFRYDHVKITVYPQKVKGFDPTSCFSDEHPDGVYYFPLFDTTKDLIADCQLTGDSFFCDAGLLSYSNIDVSNPEVNGEGFRSTPIVQVGTPVHFEADITSSGEPMCMRVTVSDEANNIVAQEQKTIAFEGTYHLAFDNLVPAEKVTVRGIGQASKAIEYPTDVTPGSKNRVDQSFSLLQVSSEYNNIPDVSRYYYNGKWQDCRVGENQLSPRDGTLLLLSDAGVAEFRRNADCSFATTNYATQYITCQGSGASYQCGGEKIAFRLDNFVESDFDRALTPQENPENTAEQDINDYFPTLSFTIPHQVGVLEETWRIAYEINTLKDNGRTCEDRISEVAVNFAGEPQQGDGAIRITKNFNPEEDIRPEEINTVVNEEGLELLETISSGKLLFLHTLSSSEDLSSMRSKPIAPLPANGEGHYFIASADTIHYDLDTDAVIEKHVATDLSNPLFTRVNVDVDPKAWDEQAYQYAFFYDSDDNPLNHFEGKSVEIYRDENRYLLAKLSGEEKMYRLQLMVAPAGLPVSGYILTLSNYKTADQLLEDEANQFLSSVTTTYPGFSNYQLVRLDEGGKNYDLVGANSVSGGTTSHFLLRSYNADEYDAYYKINFASSQQETKYHFESTVSPTIKPPLSTPYLYFDARAEQSLANVKHVVLFSNARNEIYVALPENGRIVLKQLRQSEAETKLSLVTPFGIVDSEADALRAQVASANAGFTEYIALPFTVEGGLLSLGIAPLTVQGTTENYLVHYNPIHLEENQILFSVERRPDNFLRYKSSSISNYHNYDFTFGAVKGLDENSRQELTGVFYGVLLYNGQNLFLALDQSGDLDYYRLQFDGSRVSLVQLAEPSPQAAEI